MAMLLLVAALVAALVTTTASSVRASAETPDNAVNKLVMCGPPVAWVTANKAVPDIPRDDPLGPWGACNTTTNAAAPIPPPGMRHPDFDAGSWGWCCICGCGSGAAWLDCGRYGLSNLCPNDADWMRACEDEEDKNACRRACMCRCGMVDGSTEPYHCSRHSLPPTPPPTFEPTPQPPTEMPTPQPTPFPTETPNVCNYQRTCMLLSDRGTRSCLCRNADADPAAAPAADDGVLPCDEGLVCLNATKSCVECTLGHPLCACTAAGGCDENLACVDGVCVHPPAAAPASLGAEGGPCRGSAYEPERQCNSGFWCNGGTCAKCEQLTGEIGCPCENGARCCKRGLSCDLPRGVCMPCPQSCDCLANKCLDADRCTENTCLGCREQSATCKWCNNRDEVCVNRDFPCPNGFEPRTDRTCQEALCPDVDECGGIDMVKGICLGPNMCLCNSGYEAHPTKGCVEAPPADTLAPIIYGASAGAAALCCCCIACAVCVIAGGLGSCLVCLGIKKKPEKKDGEAVKGEWWMGWSAWQGGGGGYEQQGYEAQTYDEWQQGQYDDQTAFFQSMQQQWGAGDAANGGTYDASAYGGTVNGTGQYDAYGGTVGAGGGGGGGGYGDYTQAGYGQAPGGDYGAGAQYQTGATEMQRPAAANVDFTVNFQDVTRSQAEAALGGAVAGSYLIRPSSKPSCLSLSFKDPTSDSVQHLLLAKTDAGWLRESEGEAFPDIRALLLSFTDIQLKLA